MKEQDKTELDVFRNFIRLVGLPIVPESIEKRHPPEPDIRCEFGNGELVGFELVEICNPTNARFLFSADQVYDLILSAYRALPQPIRAEFEARFVNVPLSFSFRSDVSLMAIRNSLPALLKDLALAPECDSYTHFPSDVSPAVIEVRRAGRADNPGAVNFNIAGSMDPTVPFDAVIRKLSKKYQCDTAVELLAYVGAFTLGSDRSYLSSFAYMLQHRGFGQFRRIWVMDSKGIAWVNPPTLRHFESAFYPPSKSNGP